MNFHFPIRWLAGVSLLATAALLAGCKDSAPRLADAPPPAVTVSKVVEGPVTNFDPYEGRTDTRTREPTEVRARVRGHLTNVNFEDGEIVAGPVWAAAFVLKDGNLLFESTEKVVKEGKLLFEIDPRELQLGLKAAEAQKSASDAQLALAKSEYARTYGLYTKSRSASREEVEVWAAKKLVAEAEQLKAMQAIADAKVKLGFTRVNAPINGKISRSLVSVGNLINAGGGETLLTTIIPDDPMYVYFGVPERMETRYREIFRKPRNGKETGKETGGPATPVKDLKIPIYVGLEGEEGYPHKGLIDFTEPRSDAGTGTIMVRGVLPNKERLITANRRAKVRVILGAPIKSLLITDRAVGTDQGLKYVYVVDAENVAKRRDVELGRLDGRLRVVTRGLEPGDRVIVNGIQYVRPETKVDPKLGEMPGARARKDEG